MLATVGAEETRHKNHTHHSPQQRRILIPRTLQPAGEQSAEVVTTIEEEVVHNGQIIDIWKRGNSFRLYGRAKTVNISLLDIPLHSV